MQGSIIADRQGALRQARQLLASDPKAAAAQARNLLKAEPGNAAALRLLGNALRRLGKLEEAAKTEHEAIEASSLNPAHRAAGQALQSGNGPHAHAILQQLLRDDENDVLALIMLGLQASNASEFEIAEPLLRRAVEQAPDEPAAQVALAEMLNRSRRPAMALAEIERIDGAAAASEGAQSLRAEILSALGRLDEELEILERLSAASPSDPVRYGLRIGHALRSLGREAEAIKTYRDITRLVPMEGTAWWSLANLKTVRFSDEDIVAMENGLTLANMPVQNAIRLNFALGKAHEDRGEPAAAFRYYAEGNRLRASIAPYDPRTISEWVDRCVSAFTPALFAARAGQGASAGDPIFIVGLQRSGSTLVEQILASHPQIEGTAELTDLPNIVRRLGEEAARAGRKFEQHLFGFSPDQLRALGENYLDTSRVHRTTDRPCFTDKMPNNWLYLGLIRLILPNARIVDVRRHPLACCFSNWKQLYARGLDHSNALDTMGLYYADYVRLMRHFDAVQPAMVHHIVYEELVEDIEGEVRRLLDYLDLPFDPACLEFHSNARAVRTISAGQVRQPINRGGIDQWKPFEQWLGPLKQALGETLTQWRN